jgi:ABC-type arginine/histidine transport system permease subunit
MKKNLDGISYKRSFHLTVAGFLLTLPVWIWVKQGNRSNTWPVYAWILFFGVPLIGLLLLIFGITASEKKIASINLPFSRGGLVFRLVSMPVWLILSAFKRRK